ncbi:hypothetical protein [Erysipelothrix aquatica]|uniref:hypothetical protein n=1 Tax=Erysipelothrix aquatica TaxID=2683714 RepID=UPI00135CB52E|nr:hypothetical protein [Erysipelothrix aquatica]
MPVKRSIWIAAIKNCVGIITPLILFSLMILLLGNLNNYEAIFSNQNLGSADEIREVMNILILVIIAIGILLRLMFYMFMKINSEYRFQVTLSDALITTFAFFFIMTLAPIMTMITKIILVAVLSSSIIYKFAKRLHGLSTLKTWNPDRLKYYDGG